MNLDAQSTTESIYRTRWTLIEGARGSGSDAAPARRAIELVILRYRPAILGAIRCAGINPADCEDVCQDFLVDAFLKKTLPRADRSKGRFRTFLRHTLRLYLIDYRRKMGAEKRGQRMVDSLEEIFPESGADGVEGLSVPRFEIEFELEFARCMDRKVIEELRQDYAHNRSSSVFEALIPYLLETPPGLGEMLAPQLQLSPEAVRKALSRLRQRYGLLFHQRTMEIAGEDEDPKEEMKELLKLVLLGQRKDQSISTTDPLPESGHNNVVQKGGLSGEAAQLPKKNQ